MQRAAPASGARWVRRGLAVLAFAGLSTLAMQAALREPAAAGSPTSRSVLALALAVQADADASVLEAEARRIALADPLHAIGFYLRVIAAEKRGEIDPDAAEPLMREAKRRQPAFVAPRLWLVAREYQGGDFSATVAEADAAMRINGEWGRLLVPLLLPLLEEPEGRAPLIAKLASFPGWRTPFVTTAIDQNIGTGAIQELLAAPAPPQAASTLDQERARYLTRLVNAGEGVRAYALWREYTGTGEEARIHDGDLSGERAIAPFGWTFAADGTNYAERIEAGDNDFVRAHHDGASAATLVEQVTVLPAGGWRITAEMRNGGLADPAALRWTMRCRADGRALGAQPLAGLGAEWTRVTFDIAVGGPGCETQRLALVGEPGEAGVSEVELRNIEVEAR